MNIRVRRLGAFGDVLWVEPVLTELVDSGHLLDVQTKCPDLIQNIPGVSINDRGFKADLLIDLDMAYERTPKQHILLSYFQVAARSVPIKTRLRYPKIYFSMEEIKAADAIQHPPYALFHLRWGHYRNFRKVNGVDWNVVSRHIKVKYGLNALQLQYGTSGLVAPEVATPNFRDVIPWMQRAALFVGVNSGPEQVASALSIPSVVCYGAVSAKYWHMPTFTGRIVTGPCEYAGCYHDVVSTSGQECRLPGIGSTGIPKCTLHTTTTIISAIDEVWHNQLREQPS